MLALTKGQKRALRLVLLAALLGALLLAGKLSGIGARLSAAELRALTLRAGAWGWALFTAVFALGELIHVPGLVFVAGGVLAYGRLWGGLLSWAAALVSISVTFFVVRAIGGRPLAEAESAWLRRVLSRLEARPVRTVALLRVVFILSPALNYALALSGVRYRHYLAGSAAGLSVPLLGAVVFFDVLLRYLGGAR